MDLDRHDRRLLDAGVGPARSPADVDHHRPVRRHPAADRLAADGFEAALRPKA